MTDDASEARLAALEAHPDLPALLARDPAPADTPASEVGCALGFGVLLLALGTALTLGLLVLFPPLAFLPPALMLAAAVFAAAQWIRDARALRLPLARRPALVLDRRTSLSGLGNLPTSTGHFATLELPDRTRVEVRTTEEVAERIVPGLAGVAYTRGDLLVDFRRIDV